MKRPLIKWNWVLVSAAVILLSVALWFSPDAPRTGVNMTFQHFISHPVNKRMAVFVITNQWDRKVRFVAGPPCQVKSNGVWKDLDPSGSGIWGKAASDSWEWSGTLESAASATVAVIVPEGIGDWRAAVRSGPTTPGKLERMIFHLKANWKALRELKPLPGFKGTFYSDWPVTNYSHEFIGDSIPGGEL